MLLSGTMLVMCNLSCKTVFFDVQKSHNMMLPNWTEEIWNSKTAYENLRSLQIWSFILQYNDTNLNRLKGGKHRWGMEKVIPSLLRWTLGF